MLEIESTPFPAKRLMASKYDATFSKMQAGQCVKVTPEATTRVAHAMNKWLEKVGKKDQFMVRTVSRMPDGFGRVWMLARKPMKMADLPARQIRKLDIGRAA